MSSNSRTLVVGDLLRDVFVPSQVDRLSPESPNVVIEAGTSTEQPGGAGLASIFLARRGVTTTLVSAWGHRDGELVDMLEDAGCAALNVAPGQDVPTKTRYVSSNTIVARIDSTAPQADRCVLAQDIEARFRSIVAGSERILVADYGLDAVLRAPLVRTLLEKSARTKPVVWDYHPRGEMPPPDSYVKFNLPDFNTLWTERRTTRHDPIDVNRVRHLLERHNWRAVLITLGNDGALYVDRQRDQKIPTQPLALKSAIGAGDCVAATWAACIDELGVLKAAEAAIEFTTLTLATRERAWHLFTPAPPADQVAAAAHAIGMRVVATAGCFDVMHAGHADLLRSARQLGDILIVLLNSDESVKRLKGSRRPICTVSDRRQLLLEMRSVDAVEVFGEDTPSAALKKIQPDVYVKGGDYTLNELPEARSLVANGTQVVIIPRDRPLSTTKILSGGRKCESS